MSMGPVFGIVASAAGTPLSQTAGAEVERTQRDVASFQRQVDGDERTEQAAGIGQTDADQETTERDADGRRLWESQEKNERGKGDAPADDEQSLSKQSKDPTGQSGTKLDLTG